MFQPHLIFLNAPQTYQDPPPLPLQSLCSKHPPTQTALRSVAGFLYSGSASNDFFLELHSLGSLSKPVSTHLSPLQLLYLITFFLVPHIFSYYPKLFLLLIYVLVSRLSIPIRGKLYEVALFFLFTVVLLYLDGDQAESRSPVNLE